MTPELITTAFEEQDLARVDALARAYGVTRDEMIARLLRTGLLVTERQAREADDHAERGGRS
jgi:hypothetical protein